VAVAADHGAVKGARARLGETWRFVLATWLASRLLFIVAGTLGHYLLSHTATGYPADPGGVLSYWATWDGGWYSKIATVGYFGFMWPSSTNFFPFFPLLLRGPVLLGAGAAITGVVISLAASLLALYFLYELARDYFDRDVARAATLALAFFPTAFYLNAVYTEALFLALALGSLWAARLHGNFVLAASLGCLASATRNVGVFLLLPLAHEWFRRRREAGPSGLAALALVPVGLLTYMFWLWRWSGHPLLFSTVVRRTWGRTWTNPLDTLDRAWRAADAGAVWAVHPWRVLEAANSDPSFNVMGTYDFVVLVLLLALFLVPRVQLPLGLGAYAAAVVILPVMTPAQVLPLASFSRYVLVAFPVFLALGCVLARSRLLLAGWLVASSGLGVVLTLFFTTWRWVG
jgi:hypothetical protein